MSSSDSRTATGRPERSDSPVGGRAPRSGDLGGSQHTRFIPREELEGFATWRPHAFDDPSSPLQGARSPRDNAQRAASDQAALQGARQAGYQDGYRDGLVALESFKQSFAAQMTAQLGALVAAFDAEFAGLESQIADSVAASATALARQVVRSELVQRPELVATVAAQAVEAVLLSAKHIRVHVNPDDLALVKEGAADALAARSARLMADATVSRGGCRVESDLGRIDAGIETRWAQAAATLGQSLALGTDPNVTPDASQHPPDDAGYHGVMIHARTPGAT
jgi:flagellar assembly protein FliH